MYLSKTFGVITAGKSAFSALLHGKWQACTQISSYDRRYRLDISHKPGGITQLLVLLPFRSNPYFGDVQATRW